MSRLAWTFRRLPAHVFAAACVFLAGLSASSIAARAEEQSSRPRPNFLIIFSDDQGWHDVGCYGSEIPTPAIDSLARDGLRFTCWYSASSICTPSRYGLLTGRNPSRSRDRLLGALMFLSPADARRGIHPDETTLATRLGEGGYDTALIGKWHLGHGAKEFLPTRHGFDKFYGHTGGCVDYFTTRYGNRPDWYSQEEHVDEKGFVTELITAEAVRYLKSRKDQQKPFYLQLSYNAPHFGKGWNADEQTIENILQPRDQELRRVSDIAKGKRRDYAAMTVALDDGIGQVLRALDETGLSADTLVMFMTDHGGDPVYGGDNQPLRAGKATLYEGGVRVPCLMRWPSHIPAGKTSDAVVTALDVVPTFCALARVDAEKLPVDGRDISPILLDKGEKLQQELARRELFWELGSHAELDRGAWRALRSGDWKLVEAPQAKPQLFNVQADPNERKDRAADKPDLVKRLQDRSDKLSAEYRQSAQRPRKK